VTTEKTKKLEKIIGNFSRELISTWRELEGELDTANSELNQARGDLFPAVLAFADLLEGRDIVTFGHSKRVARASVRFAEFLKWPIPRVRLLNFAALLHDIGKIIIPDSILHKEGKFTPLEFETMKLHSSTGSRIISRLGFLGSEVEEWILHHHERYNGEGYPDGLTGENIPIGARILCIVDSYDAMTTSRRYRQKIEHWVALEEIAKCGGKQFDPNLANAFQEAFQLSPPES